MKLQSLQNIQDKRKFLIGIREITLYICNVIAPKIPGVITDKTVRRAYKDGIPCEPRQSNKCPFITDVSSFYSTDMEARNNGVPGLYFDPDCSLAGFKGLADYTDQSERTVKTYVAKGKYPFDKLFGRFYFNPSSFHKKDT
jgi:hypothetical protein